jgi:hypothetical protein
VLATPFSTPPASESAINDEDLEFDEDLLAALDEPWLCSPTEDKICSVTGNRVASAALTNNVVAGEVEHGSVSVSTCANVTSSSTQKQSMSVSTVSTNKGSGLGTRVSTMKFNQSSCKQVRNKF